MARVMGMETEKVPETNLVGTPGNPAPEPRRKRPKTGKGSDGDLAALDAIIIIGVAWAVILFLYWSLRQYNN